MLWAAVAEYGITAIDWRYMDVHESDFEWCTLPRLQQIPSQAWISNETACKSGIFSVITFLVLDGIDNRFLRTERCRKDCSDVCEQIDQARPRSQVVDS